VAELVEALQSYSSHLEPSFLQISLPAVAANGTIPPTFNLSPTYINSVDAEFTRVYDEYNKRISTVSQVSEQIVKLWAELGTPQAQTDDHIVRCWREAPEQIGLHHEDIKKLTLRRDKLLDEKRNREKKLNNLKTQVETLWDRLGVEEQDRKTFNARCRGCGIKQINDFEDELSRLNELKRQNLHLFVEDARLRLQSLWDELYISEEEAVEFTPMFCGKLVSPHQLKYIFTSMSDVYSDALLSAHEAEIARLETLKEQRAPTLQLIAKHRSLVKDREDLATASQDASRLLMKGAKGERRDPTRLLREEKMRKRIAKDLPKVEQELEKTLEQWEEEYGRPFLVFGERYIDILVASAAKAPPPRSKTPNGLPARPAVRPTPAQKVPDSRAPSTMRPKTPAGTGTIGRNTARPATTQSNHTRSPSKIPSRVPLGAMAATNTSPTRSPAHTTGEENASNTLRKGPQYMAPPPRMRQLYEPPPASVMSTPSTTPRFPHDFSTSSSSIVRNVGVEDPYSSVPRPLPTPSLSSYTTMPPPARPTFDRAGSVVSTTSSTYSRSNYSGSMNGSILHTFNLAGRSTRETSSASAETSHLNGSGRSENWESLAETEDDELEPERDASDAYYAKIRAAGTGMTMTMGRSPATTGNMGLGIGLGMGTAKEFGARVGGGVAYGARAQQQQQVVQRREMSYDDETF